MKAKIRLECLGDEIINRDIEMDGRRFYSCDEPLRFGDGDKCDDFVYEHDEKLNAILEGLCDRVVVIHNNGKENVVEFETEI